MDNDHEYAEWYEKNQAYQRRRTEICAKEMWNLITSPLFSIVVPLMPHLTISGELLDSYWIRLYKNFEVCLADGSEGGKDKEEFIKNILEEKVQ